MAIALFPDDKPPDKSNRPKIKPAVKPTQRQKELFSGSINPVDKPKPKKRKKKAKPAVKPTQTQKELFSGSINPTSPAVKPTNTQKELFSGSMVPTEGGGSKRAPRSGVPGLVKTHTKNGVVTTQEIDAATAQAIIDDPMTQEDIDNILRNMSDPTNQPSETRISKAALAILGDKAHSVIFDETPEVVETDDDLSESEPQRKSIPKALLAGAAVVGYFALKGVGK